MTKTVSKLSEDGKVAIRNVRRDALKQVDANWLFGVTALHALPAWLNMCTWGVTLYNSCYQDCQSHLTTLRIAGWQAEEGRRPVRRWRRQPGKGYRWPHRRLRQAGREAGKG